MTLTAEQIAAVKEGRPVPCHLPEAGADCVLVRADVFDRLQTGYDGWTHREAAAAFWEVAGPAGWDDPEMDVYDKLYGTQP